MNHVVKINPRAFNQGVAEVLKLKPLVRIAKAAVDRHGTSKKQEVETGRVVRKKP